MVSYRRCGCSQLWRPLVALVVSTCYSFSLDTIITIYFLVLNIIPNLKYAQKILIGLYVQSLPVISNVGQVAVVRNFRKIC